MKYQELKTEFENFAKVQGLKVSAPSHFEGEKYVLAKKGAVSLRSADARCGYRFAVVLNTKRGCVSPITSFLPPKELVQLFAGAYTNWKQEVKKHLH